LERAEIVRNDDERRRVTRPVAIAAQAARRPVHGALSRARWRNGFGLSSSALLHGGKQFAGHCRHFCIPGSAIAAIGVAIHIPDRNSASECHPIFVPGGRFDGGTRRKLHSVMRLRCGVARAIAFQKGILGALGT